VTNVENEPQSLSLWESVRAVLPELEAVIGWSRGFELLHTTPAFVRDAASVEKLIWNPFCAQNLTGYLVKTPAIQSADKGKRIGICVKGCDSRSLVALIQEKFLQRDSLYVLGIPCGGVVDWRRIRRKFPHARLESATIVDAYLLLEGDIGPQRLKLEEVLARKCLRCAYPNPLLHDVMLGEPVTPRVTIAEAYAQVAAMEQLPLPERLAFWRSELDRCLRCYACRNACPLCICQDRCIAETREPKWLTQYLTLSEKFLFHFLHSVHLAGRCTECGECERVCPMDIPVTLMKEKLGQIVRELLHYEAGIDPEAAPPLLTFSPEEKGI
jgi:formate dehydrogenase subunit beta